MQAGKRVQSQEESLRLSERLLGQKKHDMHKLYRCHAPEGECISNIRSMIVAAASRDNWIAGIRVHHGKPYDGQTLPGILTQIQRMAGSPEMIPIETIAVAVIPAREISISIYLKLAFSGSKK